MDLVRMVLKKMSFEDLSEYISGEREMVSQMTYWWVKREMVVKGGWVR